MIHALEKEDVANDDEHAESDNDKNAGNADDDEEEADDADEDEEDVEAFGSSSEAVE